MCFEIPFYIDVLLYISIYISYINGIIKSIRFTCKGGKNESFFFSYENGGYRL